MSIFACFGRKLQHLCSFSCMKFASHSSAFSTSMACLYRFLFFRVNSFWVQLCYFSSVSCLGFIVLNFLQPRETSYRPKNIDMFFMSVSATTVSSMQTVEIEFFSNTQLVILTVLMLIGGEVFISMLGLQLTKIKFEKQDRNRIENKNDSVVELPSTYSTYVNDGLELGLTTRANLEYEKPDNMEIEFSSMGSKDLNYSCVRLLAFAVLGYLLVVHISGSSVILIYLSLVSSAKDVLKNKQINMLTFAVFTTVSTFANCGFIPTNENMIIFKKNSALLLLIIPQVLFGNTLYPPCLRLVISVLRRLTKRAEFDYILKYPREIGYDHLFPRVYSLYLCLTVFGFILVQFILFCCLEWHSEALSGLNSYQKIVGALFQSVSSRHSGESMVDLSTLTPAILVLYVVMMYLPPYTSFLPTEHDQGNFKKGDKQKGLLKNLIFSQLSYLLIFIVLICITERKKMSEDPLNFNVLNIVLEVVSAYGNVGFTTGYSCKRSLKPDSSCRDAWYGFSGRWSNQGKLILIVVMFFGRLKKFNMRGGRAWKLN